MDPLIGSALIGAGSQLIGGIFGGYGQKKASENYLKAQRETNEQNYKIWQEQKDHNLEMYNLQKQDTWDMWNAENEYNSASSQRERLEAAGYNPYLAISGMSGNSAGSMSTPQMQGTQTPTMQAPGIEGFNNSLSAIGASFQGIGDAVRSLYELQNLQTDTYKKYQEAKKTGSDKALTDYNLKFLQDTEQMRKQSMDLLNQEIRAKIDNFQAQTNLTNLQAKTQEILNQFIPAQQQMDLMIKVQQWVNLERDGKIKDQQLLNLVADELLTYQQIAESKSRVAVNESQVAVNESQVAVNNAQAGLIGTQNQQAQENLRILKETANDIILTARYNRFGAYWSTQNAAERYDNLNDTGTETPGDTHTTQGLSFPNFWRAFNNSFGD